MGSRKLDTSTGINLKDFVSCGKPYQSKFPTRTLTSKQTQQVAMNQLDLCTKPDAHESLNSSWEGEEAWINNQQSATRLVDHNKKLTKSISMLESIQRAHHLFSFSGVEYNGIPATNPEREKVRKQDSGRKLLLDLCPLTSIHLIMGSRVTYLYTCWISFVCGISDFILEYQLICPHQTLDSLSFGNSNEPPAEPSTGSTTCLRVN